MSVPQASEGEATSSQCACSNISLMQLFHELKQKFPGVPDHVVSTTIGTHCHDKIACEIQLQAEVKASLTHAYHASSVAGARQSAQRKSITPIKCRNQNIQRHDFSLPSDIKTEVCVTPQNATLSVKNIEHQLTVNRDNLVNEVCEIDTKCDTNQFLEQVSSPITVNIDNCTTKNFLETPSDFESVDVIAQILQINKKAIDEDVIVSDFSEDGSNTQDSDKNYKLLKSNKVKSNLHAKLEGEKEKKLTFKSPEKESSLNSDEDASSEKPKRPCTLELVKPNPELNGFGTTQSKVERKSEIPKKEEKSSETTQFVGEKKSTVTSGPNNIGHWQEQPYPVNLSVNVNCHMDMLSSPSRPTRLSLSSEPWAEEYSSPRAFTSVNLTVHTPTSNVQSPTQQIQTLFTGSPHEATRGFEGHVTVTVSPSGGRPLWRRAPLPPTVTSNVHPMNPTVVEASTPTDSLVLRQRARLSRLSRELKAERAQLASAVRERAILAAPPPSPSAIRQLRSKVENLRAQCHNMARQLDQGLTGEEQTDNEFYSNIYTGQRLQNPAAPLSRPRTPVSPTPADDEPSWQCHICTFRNHGLLNKCEECDMPRIVLGTNDSQHDTIDSGIASLSLQPQYEQRLENDRLLGSETILASDSDSLWTNTRACERV